MKTRLLIIIAIIILPLVFPQGFSQCIYNNDWPDAPCFDIGPVSHLEFNRAWASYYDYKGAEWTETKKGEMNQALEQGVLEEWVDELENYNVYRYYLSRNEIQSHLPYDGFFVTIDPNFVNPSSQPEKNKENKVDFRDSTGEIICKGYSSGGGFFEYPECGPIDQFVKRVLIVVLPIAGIITGTIFLIRRKRK